MFKYTQETVARMRILKGRERTREMVRLRDNYTCQDCGARRTYKQSRHLKKRLFDVHHLNGVCGKMSRGYDRVSDIKNLITLCHKCHYNRPDHSYKNRAIKTPIFDTVA